MEAVQNIVRMIAAEIAEIVWLLKYKHKVLSPLLFQRPVRSSVVLSSLFVIFVHIIVS